MAEWPPSRHWEIPRAGSGPAGGSVSDVQGSARLVGVSHSGRHAQSQYSVLCYDLFMLGWDGGVSYKCSQSIECPLLPDVFPRLLALL